MGKGRRETATAAAGMLASVAAGCRAERDGRPDAASISRAALPRQRDKWRSGACLRRWAMADHYCRRRAAKHAGSCRDSLHLVATRRCLQHRQPPCLPVFFFILHLHGVRIRPSHRGTPVSLPVRCNILRALLMHARCFCW